MNLKSIFNWYCLNKLCLNVAKTKYIVFSLNDQTINNFPTLYLNAIELKKISKLSSISNIRILGFLFDQNLNFTQFSEKNLAKISKSFYIINKVKNLIPKNCLKLLYFALVYCHMNLHHYFC